MAQSAPPSAESGHCMLRLSLLRGKGLRIADPIMRSSDPYAVIRVGKERRETSHLSRTTDPSWPDTMITFGPSPIVDSADEMRIELWDEDTGKDPDALGTSTLFLPDLIPREPPGVGTAGPVPALPINVPANATVIVLPATGVRDIALPVYYQGRTIGTFSMRVEVFGYRPLPVGATARQTTTPSAGGLPALPASADMKNCLRVRVVGVTDLISRPVYGCYPSVRLSIGSQAAATSVREGTTCRFGEGWAFYVTEPATVVQLLVQHHRPLLVPQFQGMRRMTLGDLLALATAPTTTLTLTNKDGASDKPRGNIQVELSWVHDSSFDACPPSAPTGLDASNAPILPAPSPTGDLPNGATGEVEDGPAAAAAAVAAAQLAAAAPMYSLAEIVEGDWRVHVHVIEARDLRPASEHHTCDPVIYVELGGQKQHTPVYKGTSTAVFDHHLIFSLSALKRSEVEGLTASISVFDANTYVRNALVGKFTFDALEVYCQPNHEYSRRWVALSNPESAKEKGITGFLQVSISVLGPSDKHVLNVEDGALVPTASASGATPAPTRTRKNLLQSLLEEQARSFDAEVNADALVLLPPTVTRVLKWLVLSVHEARGLPALDRLPGFTRGIDAFVEVAYGGSRPLRTKWVTKKGAGDLDVQWRQELWIPYSSPFLSSRVNVRVMDYDMVATQNDCAGTVVLNLRDIEQSQGDTAAWWPIYGAPPSTANAQARKMNDHPELATTYNGSLLLSARVGTAEEEDDTEIGHVKSVFVPSPSPPITVYQLRCLVVMGEELPTSQGPIGVAVCTGSVVKYTECVAVSGGGQASWNGQLIKAELRLPSDGYSPLPDTFIYLYRGDIRAGNETRFAYARISTAAIRDRGLAASAPYWQTFREDVALNCLRDSESAGSVLLRVGIGSEEEAAAITWDTNPWSHAEKGACELRVHAYQGRGLPAADANGSLDPYLRVSLNGVTKMTDIRYATTCPGWYQTLSIPTVLPNSLVYAPQVHIQLFDKDLFSDDYVAEMRYNLASDTLLQEDGEPGSRDPVWYALTRIDTGYVNSSRTADYFGELLLHFQLLRVTPGVKLALPKPIDPLLPSESVEYYLDIIALGCRDLRGWAFAGVNNPAVVFDVGPRAKHNASSKGNTSIVSTARSRFPSPASPNYCQRILVPVRLPKNAFFGGCVNLAVTDTRIGGLFTSTLGTAVVDLSSKIPWSPTYQPPRGVANGCSDTNPFSAQELPVCTAVPPVPTPPWADKQQQVFEEVVPVSVRASARPAPMSLAIFGHALELTLPVDADAAEAKVIIEAALMEGLSFQQATSRYASIRRPRPFKEVSTLKRGGVKVAAPVSAIARVDDQAALAAQVLKDQFARQAFPSELLPAAAGTDGNESGEEELPLLRTGGGARVDVDSAVVLPARKAATRRTSTPAYPVEGERARGGGGAGVAMEADPSALTENPLLPPQKKGTGTSPDDIRIKVSDGGELMSAGGKTPSVAVDPAVKHFANDSEAHVLAAGYGVDMTRYLATLNAASGVIDGKIAAVLQDRRLYTRELEDVMQSAPFEKFPIIRGRSTLSGGGVGDWGTDKVTGYFKGIVRLVQDKNSPPPIDLAAFTTPKAYKVRVYVLKGHDLTPADTDGFSDPYLVVKLGSTVLSNRDKAIKKSLQPEFYQSFEFTTVLPGPSSLEVQVWDRDVLFDDLIGQTSLDLEDRVFEPAWKALGVEHETGTRLRLKPVETRFLRIPSSKQIQGSVRMWVDILSSTEAAMYPMLDIMPTPPRKFQLRTIVWKAKGIPIADPVSRMSDIFFRATLNNVDKKETDVHYRSSDGKGSFNWRMTWPIDLPRKYFRLKLQAWDADLLLPNDALGEVHLDLSPAIRRAIDAADKGIHILKSDKLVTRRPVESGPRTWWQYLTCEPPRTTVEVIPLLPHSTRPASVTPSGGASIERDGSSALESALGRRNPIMLASGLTSAASQLTATSAIKTLKRMAGYDVFPRHAQWIPLRNPRTQQQTGQVLVTLELLPAELAAVHPVGEGRSEPNKFPHLPPPIGRVRCSANPCYLLNACCGARLFTSLICCCLCLGIAVVGILGAPFITSVQTWMSVLPTSARAVIWTLISAILVFPPLYCYLRYVACPRREQYGEADLDDYATDESDMIVDGVPGSLAPDSAQQLVVEGDAGDTKDPTSPGE